MNITMDENSKSLALQYDLFMNRMLKCLDSSTEKDYVLKLKIIDELSNKIIESNNDEMAIKNALETLQDECSKLTYKLKTSAKLFDAVQDEKGKLEVEKQNMELKLKNLHSVFKKLDTAKISQSYLSHSNTLDQRLEKNKTLNNTDDLLSNMSFSQSEDSSYENVKPNCMYESSASNLLTNLNAENCESKSNNGRQIIATTTMTMELGSVVAKSVLKIHPIQTPKDSSIPSSSSSNSVESSIGLDNKFKLQSCSIIDKNIKKEHNFVQKLIVIPEICGKCHKKIKFNNSMVKCLDCKAIAHLECQDLMPTTCTFNQNQIDALNCGVPHLIVHCISEIERRGLDTIGLYRVSGSDKEVKNLREKFSKTIFNLIDIDIHVLCSCLKDFIRMQNSHIISQSHLSKMTNALKESNENSNPLCESVLELPTVNRNVLAFLILHLQKVASSPKCSMDYNSLAIVFGPTIVGFSSTCLSDLQIKSAMVFKVMMALFKLPKSFWIEFLKADISSSDEVLHSTPNQSQSKTPRPARDFFSPGHKRRSSFNHWILDSKKKKKKSPN